MNNEPVAWILGGHLDAAKKMPHLCRVTPKQENEGYIPLYTHPAKTLTDEEIHKIAQEHFHAGLGINPLDFARAILKRGSAK